MKYLTRKEVLAMAPGATPRRDAAKERLLCTDWWLDMFEENGYRPVFALQGTSHEDSDADPKDGRHFIVTSDDEGHAVSILNSHDRLQRVWSGLGLWKEELLLIDVAPIQRWKWNYLKWTVDPVRSHSARQVLSKSYVTNIGIHATFLGMVSTIAKTGYIAGRGRPSADALLEASRHPEAKNALDAACAIVAACRRGNLAPSTHAKTRRNVKGIRRPDAYQHLALAAFKAAMDVVSK